MKKSLVVILSAVLCGFLFSAYSTNMTNQTGDITGSSPLSGGTDCQSCHNSSATTPPTIIYVKPKGESNMVTTYTPGKEYTVFMSSAKPLGVWQEFGYQACVLDTSLINAGTITAATQGSALILKNGVAYLEHANPISVSGSTARIQFEWTAPRSVKPVKIYAVFLHSNGANNAAGDATGAPGSFTLTSDSTAPSSISGLAKHNLDIKLYPNPATDVIHLSVSRELKGHASINIYGSTGQRIKSHSFSVIPGADLVIPVENLAQGNYFLHFTSGNQSGLKMFSINR